MRDDNLDGGSIAGIRGQAGRTTRDLLTTRGAERGEEGGLRPNNDGSVRGELMRGTSHCKISALVVRRGG